MSRKNRSAKRTDEASVESTNIKDKSPYVFQREKLKQPLNIYQRYEMNEKQRLFIDTALDKKTRLVMCDGIWGSSKTFLSVYCSLKLLSDKRVDSILYVRSPVESGQSIGFTPGTAEEKMNPYAEPLFQKLHEMLDEPTIKMLENDKRIEVVPPGFMRGVSWACKAVIIDEAANFPREMLELIISRVGPFCKVFIIGSRHQSDIGKPDGFIGLFKAFDDAEARDNGIHCFYFNEEADIVRSDFVKFCMRRMGVLKPVEPIGAAGDWVPGG